MMESVRHDRQEWINDVTLAFAFLGFIGSWIAVQQRLIARKKLNYDLFDKRFAVFVATQNYMVSCLNQDGGSREDTRIFYEATRPAPFLFDKEINEFLKELMTQSVFMQVFGKYRDKPTAPGYQEMMGKYHAAQSWMGTEYEKVSERFYTIMNLSNLKPFSMSEVISVPDGQVLREKLLLPFMEKD